MPDDALLTLLTRAVRQPAFRDLLLRDPDRALSGYVLSPSESYRLRTLTPEIFDQLAADIKARLTPPVGINQGDTTLN